MPKAESLGTITIANGATQGNILASEFFSGARQIIIFGPATLAETVTVQVAPNISAAAADMRAAKFNGGAAITFTGASAMVIDCGGFRAISLLAGGAVAAQRDFTVQAVF